ncbi:MAG: ferrous iron transport protein B [Bacillota bacterium]|nr:ferrous iron transport protein B [Bacillota bacterium]
MATLEIALFGNPNTGKTSLFNMLTGSYEYVGNWSGVTVEKKVGELKNKKDILIDLPGIYSLNPLSKDEAVATEYLLNESFQAILNIVDASQLRRNLHLTIQLLEFGVPMVLGLNMVDVAQSQGINIDIMKLSKCLGLPVQSIVARTGKGCREIGDCIVNPKIEPSKLKIDYGPEVEKSIQEIIKLTPAEIGINRRWLAIQLIEGNSVVTKKLAESIKEQQMEQLLENLELIIQEKYGEKSLQHYIYKKRQSFINSIIEDCVTAQSKSHKTLTEYLDAIVTNRYLGLIIFLGFMFLIFKLTFDWLGTPISGLLDKFFNGPLTTWVESGLTAVGASSFIHDVIIQGIIGGVGGVLVFVPQIFILFFFISLLEDSGYMARIAMVMDRIMQLVGLNGKAFIPLIIGFGCNVPGIMSARTIEQPKERLLTILLSPLMSCSARLTVYSLFVATFFKSHQAIIVLSFYVLGIVVAILLAKVFSFFLKSEESIFVVELPPYRIPQFRTLMRSTWEKGKGFVKKAGTFILGGTIAIWLLSYVGPSGVNVPADHSILSIACRWIAPIFTPLGFGTWQAVSSLITGFLAKEIVVSSMNVIYFVPNGGSLQQVISHVFTPLSAYSFMTFILIYVPCLATVATIQKETGSKKWMYFSISYGLVVAYILSFIVFQGGRLLGIGV